MGGGWGWGLGWGLGFCRVLTAASVTLGSSSALLGGGGIIPMNISSSCRMIAVVLREE